MPEVEVKYQGPIQGAFAVISPSTGRGYAIDGRGCQFLVDEGDVEWLTTPTRYGEEYVVIERQTVVPIEPVVLPPVDFGAAQVVESSLPDVRAMTERQAKKTVSGIDNLLDLRVIEAVENGTERRPAVLAAIDARRKELAG